ncbi:MAG: ABC transporter substrate-binding protein, partial [Alphaproteobacteria bacterium]|nr:ABC transporter substrate-binding protein [Alphaproteobacteria bacterium]
ADLGAKKVDIEAIKGLRIGAAPFADLGLKQMLVEAGIDIEKDRVEIGPVPGAFTGKNVNFGVAAARALADGKVDGFWANGMGAEVAVRSGAGTMVIDARRGDGPAGAFNYTMPALITTDRLIEENPDAAAAVVRALVKTHAALKEDTGRATTVGRKLFPAEEAELIADVVERDLPYYDASISREFVSGMSQFSQDVGLIKAPLEYEQVVATQFSELWTA